ncbi:phage tail sheath subtilisin-like domain-containing protein [Parasegetibacter sp. NRK P23]|uniref:phage tail sheath family protein n=1 Tax=Parasegetibacter sp. NRK P23 TaxID=2942999 RepID=UPI002042E450|nr:phage tail sheath subtilisin-like domain-containing protein [Parasegetibacter sp. NRK P23]MCM5528965.1 phage tail sheath subtilisin-like domain-containing protein [Parasegetibacter sp. NRK P23]
MAADFLHGVETIEVEVGGQTIRVVKSSVVALLGIAPIGAKNQLVLCSNQRDDAQFGKALPGFNIPKALQIIRSIAGSAPVLVVNTFDTTANTEQVTAEEQTVVAGRLKLAHPPIGAVTIKLVDGTTDAPIVLGTDYTLDEFGNFQAISSEIENATVYKFSYKKLDAETVTPTQLIGGVDGSNVRTGLALFDLAYNTFGFKAKVFISPNYSSLSAISTAFSTAAQKNRGIYLLDAPFGTTIAGAIAGRGPSGGLVFNTSDERAYLLYPYLKTFDDYSQADAAFPYSAFMAGVIIRTDNDLGYWFSPSNKEITGVTGSERIIEWSINDPDCEANQLNAVGIATIAAGYGTGIRTWGNRNASFPNSTSVKNFVAIRRTDDMVIESMELASINFVDLPLSQAMIDTIREAGNALLRTEIQRGAVLPGSSVNYNPEDNSASDLASGKVTFERVYMVPPPLERITYRDVLDISLLNQFN